MVPIKDLLQRGFDRDSLQNCFDAIKNYPEEEGSLSEVIDYAKRLLNHYVSLYPSDYVLMKKQVHEFHYLLSCALGNSFTGSPNDESKSLSTEHQKLVVELMKEYSRLLDEFFVKNLNVYLVLFLCLMCLDKDFWIIRRVVLRVQAKFITEFEYIVKQAPKNLVNVMGGLIIVNSFRWSYKSEISEGIFSHLMVIDSKIALLAIADELKGDRHDREGRWTPSDIDVNSIYRDMERGRDYCI